MGEYFYIFAWMMCFSLTQVLSNEPSPPDSTLESRQGLIGSPLANPSLLSLDALGLGAQNNFPLLQQPGLYNPALLNMGSLQSLAELQGLAELQSLAGQGLQDPQSSFLKRTGPFGLGLRNGNFLPRGLGLRQPFPLGLSTGYRGQESVGDLLRLNALLGADGINRVSPNPLTFSQSQPLQSTGFNSLFTGGAANNRDEEDRELTELLQLLSSVQSPSSNNLLSGALTPTPGLRRLSPSVPTRQALGRGGRLISNFPLKRQGLEAEGVVTVSRVGTPDDGFTLFPKTAEGRNKNHRQLDIETSEEQRFLFPNLG